MALLTQQPGRDREPSPRVFWVVARILICLVIGLCVGRLQASSEDTEVSNEFQVKAAFLFNFLKFVDWPAQVLAANDSPITIGIMGDDPFGSALPATIRDENVHGHPLVLHRSHNIEDLRDCQLVFVSQSESAHDAKILGRIADLPILTVSDSDGFCENGGVIQLYLENKKVRFMINQATAQRLGLKISSQLLSVAKVFGASTSDKKN